MIYEGNMITWNEIYTKYIRPLGFQVVREGIHYIGQHYSGYTVINMPHQFVMPHKIE